MQSDDLTLPSAQGELVAAHSCYQEAQGELAALQAACGATALETRRAQADAEQRQAEVRAHARSAYAPGARL